MPFIDFFSSKSKRPGPVLSKSVDIWKKKDFSWTGTFELTRNKLISGFVHYPPELPCIRDNRSDEYTIIYEKDFEKIIYTWKQNTLDATWFSLKLYHTLQTYDLTESQKSELTDALILAHKTASLFLKSCIKNKLFTTSPHCERVSLHSIHSALGVLIALSTKPDSPCDWNKPIGQSTLIDTLTVIVESHAEAKAIINNIVEYTLKCSTSPHNDRHCNIEPPSQPTAGYADVINDQTPSITATASALWILWQTGHTQHVDPDHILAFISNLSYTPQFDSSYAGFINSVRDESPLICSTYYAMRVLYALKETYNISSNVSQFLSSPRVEKIKRFIVENATANGFSPKIGALPTMIHTKDAFALMQQKYNLFEFKNSITIERIRHSIQNIHKFWKSCSFDNETPLVGFSTNSFFYPNIYATLLLTEIDRYLTKLRENSSLALTVSPIIHQGNISAIINFLNSCRIPEDSPQYEPGFRCYSYSPDYIPSSFLERISK